MYISPEIANYHQETGLEIVYEEVNSKSINKQSRSIAKSSIGLFNQFSAIGKENNRKNKTNNFDDQFEIKGSNLYQLFDVTSASTQNSGKKISDIPILKSRSMIRASKKIRLSSNFKEKDRSLNLPSLQINDIVLVGSTFNNIVQKGKNNSLKYSSNKATLNSELSEIVTARELQNVMK